MKNENQVRAVISAIFAFLVFLSFSGILVCAGLSITVFDLGHLNKSLKTSGYIEKNYKALEQALKTEEEQHSLPEGILTVQLDENDFAKLLKNNIQSVCGGAKSSSADQEKWEKALTREIDGYFKSEGVGKNAGIDAAADEIIQNAASYYENYTTFPFGSFFANYRKTAFSIMKVLIPAAAVLAIALIFILLKLQPLPYRGWYYVFSSSLGAALISIITGGWLRFGVNYDFSQNLIGYQAFIDTFFGSAAKRFWMLGLAIILLSLIGFVAIKKYEIKRNHEVQN
ncbi:hypothetical protein LI177_01865 [bacterium 210820-DFI.6.37]|nr:hypothetical protein [bacterium 210820-DFI.6.37]